MNLVGIEKAGDNRYQYNEQSEKQQDPTGNGYFYETPLRQYDPQLGRFNGVDLLAEEYATMSPYSYAANNPILFSDPTGARPAPCYCDGYMRGAGEMFDKNSGRIRINTIGGTYTTSSGNTYGGGSGYSYGGGYTANDRMNAMYGEANAEQALQTLAQGWGGSYSNGNLYFSYGSAYTSNYRPNGDIGIIYRDYIQVGQQDGNIVTNEYNPNISYWGTAIGVETSMWSTAIDQSIKTGNNYFDPKVLNKANNVSRTFAAAGVLVSLSSALYANRYKKDNTSTWVDVGITATIAVVGVAASVSAAPLVGVFAIGYGIYRMTPLAVTVDGWIDSKVGFR